MFEMFREIKMKLETKRNLVARALKVGKNRIIFNTARLSELKENSEEKKNKKEIR